MFRIVAAALLGAGTSASLLGGAGLQPKAGAPLHGLTPDEEVRFWSGRGEFSRVLTWQEGLGPIFTSPSCGSCHTTPLGGWGISAVLRFGYVDDSGFDPLVHLGGPVFQHTALTPECQEVLPPPPVANIYVFRVTNSSLAAGLIEAIPDAAILANADPFDLDGDGVSGRAHLVPVLEECRATPEGPDCPDGPDGPVAPLRVGRFGWKAQIATVLGFSADAAHTELGLTNRVFPVEHAPSGDLDLLALCDHVADPEDGPDAEGFHFIDRVTDFQRFLGPPPQTPRSGMTGEALFVSIGCAACHVPEWTTADDPELEPALRARTIRPYSDFLLHDMGLLGDGIPDRDAGPLEMRTPVLWNLATRPVLLHDGRAESPSFHERIAGPGGAIWWHNVAGSEAQGAASAFFALPEADQLRVVQFLRSLGRLEFDANRDGKITIVDFNAFRECFVAGDAGAAVHPDGECAVHDFDQNGVIDLADFAWFLLAYESIVTDCDGDGIVDLEAILLGAPDRNGDGIPDDCVGATCPGDINGDGLVGAADLGALLAAWGSAEPLADLDGDGVVDAVDLGVLLAAWGACPPGK
ncbi:MAG TPA: di-heme oxidoredictase family protein [Phycisphaerales bacterium]|nr:di-heme oxidoredictase family protein [Phycisphaerales bacterium]HMP38671.1 di-heme oxidoredictase family protein [Phycisphaerales bacterium]